MKLFKGDVCPLGHEHINIPKMMKSNLCKKYFFKNDPRYLRRGGVVGGDLRDSIIASSIVRNIRPFVPPMMPGPDSGNPILFMLLLSLFSNVKRHSININGVNLVHGLY